MERINFVIIKKNNNNNNNNIVIQRFNAVAFLNTFVLPDLDKDGHSRVNIAY